MVERKAAVTKVREKATTRILFALRCVIQAIAHTERIAVSVMIPNSPAAILTPVLLLRQH